MYFGNWMPTHLLEKADDTDECMLKYAWNGLIGFSLREIILLLLNPEHKYAHPSSMLEKLKPILISNFFERVFSGFTPALMSEKPFSFIQSIVAVIASIAYPGEHKRDWWYSRAKTHRIADVNRYHQSKPASFVDNGQLNIASKCKNSQQDPVNNSV